MAVPDGIITRCTGLIIIHGRIPGVFMLGIIPGMAGDSDSAIAPVGLRSPSVGEAVTAVGGVPGITAHIPNSLFLANTVKNETNLWNDYVFHLMTIPIQADDNWKTKEKGLLNAAREICSPYMEDARRAMSTQAFQHSLEEPSIDPRVQVQVTGADQYLLILRIPVPVRKRGRMEQEITRRYLELTLKG